MVNFSLMNCSVISPAEIELLNFLLSFVPWVPAASIFALFLTNLYKKIQFRYPGYDNTNRRTVLYAVAGMGSIAVFFVVWGAGLLLTKDFRCTFL